MENLIALVDSLRPGEIQLIQHLYSFKNNPENKKRDRLLRLIIEKEARDEETALLILYGDKSYSAFSQLKARLKDDIMNVLLLQDPSVKFTAKYAQASFDCRRAIIQGEILLARGVYQEALSVLTRAGRVAKKYELYAEQVIVEDLMRTHIIAKGGNKQFTELSISIEEAISELERLQRVKHEHFLLTKPDLGRSSGIDFSTRGATILAQLEEEMKKSGSVRIRFYYHLAALSYHLQQQHFDLALEFASRLLELVESEPVLQSKANLAGVKTEMADIMLNLGRYHDAITYAQQSLECFKPGMLNELNTLYKMFFAYFRLNDITRAEEIFLLGNKHKQLKYNEFLSAHWNMLKAALEFRKGEHTQVVRTLKKDITLTRDKSSWQLGYYLLDIMNMIEISENNEWVENKIESLKKVIYRQGEKVSEEYPRFICIARLLQSIVNNSYDFYSVAENEKELLNKLIEAKDKYHWNPSGPEIIRFDQWLLAKIKPARKAS